MDQGEELVLVYPFKHVDLNQLHKQKHMNS
jgi:hypothetical protein